MRIISWRIFPAWRSCCWGNGPSWALGLPKGPEAALLFVGSRTHGRGTFCSCKKYPKTRQPPSGWTPAFAQLVCISFDTGQPLNFCPLASDLRRGSRPASAVALLKGQANLFLCRAAYTHGNRTDFRPQKRTNSQPEGRQAKSDNHCTDYEGPAALWKFSGNWVSPLQASDWTKAGTGVSPAAFWLLCRRGQSNPR